MASANYTWTFSSSEVLTRLVKELYNIDRLPGESDEALQARCFAILERYSPKPEAQGATCTKCHEHNEYAAPNAAYVCYRCRV